MHWQTSTPLCGHRRGRVRQRHGLYQHQNRADSYGSQPGAELPGGGTRSMAPGIPRTLGTPVRGSYATTNSEQQPPGGTFRRRHRGRYWARKRPSVALHPGSHRTGRNSRPDLRCRPAVLTIAAAGLWSPGTLVPVDVVGASESSAAVHPGLRAAARFGRSGDISLSMGAACDSLSIYRRRHRRGHPISRS